LQQIWKVWENLISITISRFGNEGKNVHTKNNIYNIIRPKCYQD